MNAVYLNTAQIREDYRSGMTRNEIAAKHRTTRAVILAHMKANGIPQDRNLIPAPGEEKQCKPVATHASLTAEVALRPAVQGRVIGGRVWR
tara:strand:- start:7074 stop:7346 length:273 start_codon:yes stop_codon:yes gene_type:complete